ncbi:hypothetical protein [Mangrovicoccus algicola]|uniref:Lipoprotein n=1 Tax=Mangrovicoccus algicola TaxID=2771008 RepID=A0A8J6Z9U3_9RHOB|nr:hypothetical protein [Mangrovicoccus algicola]MBE3638696.1 hypothetical protein [Mangrovicoccus algicola]
MTTRISATLLLAAGLLAGCAPPPEADRQVPVSDAFAMAEAGWTRGPGGIEIRYAAFPGAEDKVVVCGAYATSGAQGTEHLRTVVRDSGIAMNGVPIIENLTFFNKVARPDDLDGAMANCRVTAADYPEGVRIFQIYRGNEYKRYRM